MRISLLLLAMLIRSPSGLWLPEHGIVQARAYRSAPVAAMIGGAKRLTHVASTGLVAATILASPGDTTVTVTMTVAPSGGTAPITTTLYRHTSTFTPPGTGTSLGTIAVGSPVTDTGRTNGVTYYYEAVSMDNLSATANSNEVTAVPASGGGASPIVDIDFATAYANTAAYLADTTNWDTSDQENTSLQSITGGKLRYTYNFGGNPCDVLYIRNGLKLPGSPFTELWAEFKATFSTAWQFAPSCGAGDDHKCIHFETTDTGNGRWGFRVRVGTPNWGMQVEHGEYPNVTGGYFMNVRAAECDEIYDGVEHTFRFHIKTSTTQSSNNGVLEVWIDGELLHHETTLNSTTQSGSRDSIDRITFCHNAGYFSVGHTPTIDFSRIRVYSADPVW